MPPVVTILACIGFGVAVLMLFRAFARTTPPPTVPKLRFPEPPAGANVPELFGHLKGLYDYLIDVGVPPEVAKSMCEPIAPMLLHSPPQATPTKEGGTT